MGNHWSSMEQEPDPDPWWPTRESESTIHTSTIAVDTLTSAETQTKNQGRVKENELEAFKQDLAKKRALRHEALAALHAEMKELRSSVEEERSLRIQAEEERDQLKITSQMDIQKELEIERKEKEELLEERECLRKEVEEKAGLARQVQALKDVSEIGKEMLRIRELQVKELKKKLIEINITSVMAPPEDLRVEYEKQIENIRKLRSLYEERAAATLLEHRRELEREEARITVLETKISDLQKETDEYKEAKKVLEEKIENLEGKIQQNEDELEKTKDDLFSKSVQNKSLNSQMTLINNLFSQMLVSPQIDLDRLTRLLKEHHGLITDLTSKGDSNEVAALLVDLAGQIEKEKEDNQTLEDDVSDEPNRSELQVEIASNLSKVWRVMIELLSHHQSSTHTELAGGVDSCYKCVQTPSGPRSVISVSQTFLTLKDLILEKNSLVKEVGRLKTLNNHLENRLGSQEKRLSVVTTELRKTWSVVNKLKAQHKQLHTHEKILRYELQQKRCMLTELKQELEHCKDKWERARKKNSETEEDWKKLRKEFAARKSRQESNSAESGYEEEEVHSPILESTVQDGDLFGDIEAHQRCDELQEEEIEHSDGNSFDTVIDLLDITCLEAQSDTEPYVLCEVTLQQSEPPPGLMPLSESEFTEGLDQIESEDLAAVLDIQYQNQLLGADYNLSLPSSSISSPIPTENDDFASSEMDISEEDVSSSENLTHSSPELCNSHQIPEEKLLFGSNSSKNISKFLDGLFNEQSIVEVKTPNLILNVPCTSQAIHEDELQTPLVNNENEDAEDSQTPLVNNKNNFESSFIYQIETSPKTSSDQIQETVHGNQVLRVESLPLDSTCNQINAAVINQELPSSSSECFKRMQEELLNAREDRLKRLELQCRSLVSKVTSTSFRSGLTSSTLHTGHDVSEIDDSQPKEITSGNSKTVSNIASSTDNSVRSSQTHIQDGIMPSSSQLGSQNKTPEEILEARTERLKRLEKQCKSLFSKMSATSSRSNSLSDKLDELHMAYGPSEHNTTTEQENLKIPSTVESQNADSKVPDLATESKEILNKCSRPGPSVEQTSESPISLKKGRSPEEILDARAERFKRLEEQCKSLVSKMTATSLRSEIITNKLDELHSYYGSTDNDEPDNDDDSSLSSREAGTKISTIASPNCNRITACLNESINQQTENSNLTKTCVETIKQSNSSQLSLVNADITKRSPEEVLEARAQRLNRLEEQCKSLFNQMSATSQRSEVISNRLEELHEQYGQSEQMPSTSSVELENASFEDNVTNKENE